MKTTWDFVERFYPKYYSCSLIARCDDYKKIITGEINGEAETLYNRIRERVRIKWGKTLEEEDVYNEVEKEVLSLSSSLTSLIYQEAIQNFLETQVDSSKAILKEKGFYTDNLWQVGDVQRDYDCSDELAQEILEDVLHSDRIVQEINETIDDIAEHEYDLVRKDGSGGQ